MNGFENYMYVQMKQLEIQNAKLAEQNEELIFAAKKTKEEMLADYTAKLIEQGVI